MTRKIFMNGNIYTFNLMQPKVDTVVVDNGKIIDLGSHNDMLLQWGRRGTELIDLQGKMVTPGLIDSHLHLSGIAFKFLELNLTDVLSKKEMLQKIKEKTSSLPKDRWLIGMGWDENVFTDGGIPTIAELDHVAPHHPIFLKRICHHAFLVNSIALDRCGYHPQIVVPAGGRIELDPYTKKPTGLILESASDLFTKCIPPYTYNELKNSLSLAIDEVVNNGLTSVHTNDPLYLGGFDQTYQMYDELLNKEGKNLRCHLLIDHHFLSRLSERKMYTGFGNEKLQIGAIKLFADGAFGQRTALLSEPYDDSPNHFGKAIYDQEELWEIIRKVRSHSLPVAVHTIGDQALTNVLDILDQFPAISYRDRLIHVSLLRDDLIKRLSVPTRVVDIQPRFIVGDFPWLKHRLGKKRWKNTYKWKSLLTAGVLCAGGSDAPIEPVNPLLSIHAAVTRRDPKHVGHGWNVQEQLSMKEALQLYTIGGAYATNEEHIKGTIARGKRADMTVFSKDLFSLEHMDELLTTKISMTIIDGHIQS